MEIGEKEVLTRVQLKVANIPYLKGVRTRFYNILSKEVDIADVILNENLVYADKGVLIQKTDKCIERMKIYREKLEIQTDRLASVLGDTDEEILTSLLEDDSLLTDRSTDLSIDLADLKDKLKALKVTEDEETKSGEKVSAKELMDLQHEMQNIVVNQMKQNQKVLEMSEKREEMNSAVKLPKIDLISYNGDKLKWTEFWDAFKCTVHKNTKLSNIEKFIYLKIKVYGEAKRAISGISLTDGNYSVAIKTLKERFKACRK
jgi:hypothetical protein